MSEDDDEECSFSCTRNVCEWCPANDAVAADRPVHVLPVDDLIKHEDVGDDCLCGPTIKPVGRGDGSMGWLVVHHSLDGREKSER